MKFIPHTGDRVKVHANEGAYGGEVLLADNRSALPHSLITGPDGNREYIAHHELQDRLAASKGKQVIALTADDRTGKTRVAFELATRLGAHSPSVVSFATALRDMAWRIDAPVADGVGWRQARREAQDDLWGQLLNDAATVSTVEEERLINDYFKTYYPGYRDALFNLAEAVKAYRPEFFVEVVIDEIDKLFSTGCDLVIIDDLRFPVEYEYLNSMLHDFTVFHLVPEETATQEANPTDGMRHEWRGETGGEAIVVPEGKGDEAISETADKIIKHMRKPISLAETLDVSAEKPGLTEAVEAIDKAAKQFADVMSQPPGTVNALYEISPHKVDALNEHLASLEKAVREHTEVTQAASHPQQHSIRIDAQDVGFDELARMSQQPVVQAAPEPPALTQLDAHAAYQRALSRVDTASWEDSGGECVIAAEDAKQIIVSILEGFNE